MRALKIMGYAILMIFAAYGVFAVGSMGLWLISGMEDPPDE